MKRYIGYILSLSILLLGAVGAILRSIELVRYIEPSTNLYHASGLMAWALPLVSAAAIAVSVVVGKKTSRGQTGSFCEVFATHGQVPHLILIGSAVLLIVAGIFKTISVVASLFDAIAVLPYMGKVNVRTLLRLLSVAQLVYGILTIVAGISMIGLASARRRCRETDTTRFLATIPIFWACFLLILTFMEHPVEPVFHIFAYDLLGAAAIVLSVHYTSAFLFGKVRIFKNIVFSLLSLYFIMVTVGGRAIAFLTTHQFRFLMEVPFRMVAFVAMFGYILINAMCVLAKTNDIKE